MEQIALTFKSAAQYIDAIKFLEEHLGHDANFNMMDPKSIYFYSPNMKATKILDFLNFSHKPITVCEHTNDEDVAGRIEETPDMCFIEISPFAYQNSDYLSAVLAHEIMHHYLSCKGIKKYITLDNEVLTDIATIYAGLGQLTLNGVYAQTVSYQENTRITHTHIAGYIDFDSFCFVYCIICKLRNLPDSVILSGLYSSVADAVSRMKSNPIYTSIASFCLDNHSEATFNEYLSSLSVEPPEMAYALEKLEQKEKELSAYKTQLENLTCQKKKLQQELESVLHLNEYNPILRKLTYMSANLKAAKDFSSFESSQNTFFTSLGCKSEANSKSNDTSSKKGRHQRRKAPLLRQDRPNTAIAMIIAVVVIILLVITCLVITLSSLNTLPQ